MPIIYLEYDDKKINDDNALQLSIAIKEIVSKVTDIKDVCVYANSAKIKVQAHPIEIFIQMSQSKINNIDKLMEEIKENLKEWKEETNFQDKINLTIIPMGWKIEIGI